MIRRVSSIVSALALSCASLGYAQQADPPRAIAGLREFYAAYESALKAHRRDTLARFYHPSGALIVVDGSRMSPTHAGIDSIYRGSWQGPAFFAFDSLHFDAVGPAMVAVTGGFRWLPPQSADTARFIYFALLDRTAGGLRIRVEHETQRPKPQR